MFRTSQAALGRISFSEGLISPKLWTLLKKYGIFSIGRTGGWRLRSDSELEFLSLGQQQQKTARPVDVRYWV